MCLSPVIFILIFFSFYHYPYYYPNIYIYFCIGGNLGFGIGKGLLGLVIHPVSGALTLAGNVTKDLAHYSGITYSI